MTRYNLEKLPDKETLDLLLSYDDITGKLHWNYRTLSLFDSAASMNRWNGKNAGKEAFTSKTLKGYRQGRIFRKNLLAHRVIWTMFYGVKPDHEIDHINGDKVDNRICNLRKATISENLMNRGAQSNNTSGYKGVSYYKRRGVWEANISKDGVSRRIGYFNTAEEASIAYNNAVIVEHGYFNYLEGCESEIHH